MVQPLKPHFPLETAGGMGYNPLENDLRDFIGETKRSKKMTPRTKNPLRIVAVIAMAFAATTATAAKKIEVKVTNYSGEPLLGYWVEYEINGVKYRSDRAPVRMNQIAWEHMSDADRETTVRNVYGVFNARRDQFGDKAEELGYWFDKKQGWVQGAETLTIGLVKRDFPEVYKKMNTDWRSLITIEGYDSKKPFATSPEIDKIK